MQLFWETGEREIEDKTEDVADARQSPGGDGESSVGRIISLTCQHSAMSTMIVDISNGNVENVESSVALSVNRDWCEH